MRNLSDGTEELLLTPRKDVEGVYDPEVGSLEPYTYDPYGKEETSESETSPAADLYDLRANPFRYAGEYRDPVSDAIYLRARELDLRPLVHLCGNQSPPNPVAGHPRRHSPNRRRNAT